jgi:hypothetical protein
MKHSVVCYDEIAAWQYYGIGTAVGKELLKVPSTIWKQLHLKF